MGFPQVYERASNAGSGLSLRSIVVSAQWMSEPGIGRISRTRMLVGVGSGVYLSAGSQEPPSFRQWRRRDSEYSPVVLVLHHGTQGLRCRWC